MLRTQVCMLLVLAAGSCEAPGEATRAYCGTFQSRDACEQAEVVDSGAPGNDGCYWVQITEVDASTCTCASRGPRCEPGAEAGDTSLLGTYYRSLPGESLFEATRPVYGVLFLEDWAFCPVGDDTNPPVCGCDCTPVGEET